MEYQIGFLEALNVMYITGNFFATALLIFFEIIPFIFSVFLYRIVASRIAKIFSIFLFFLFICLFLFIGLIPVCNSGWQIDGNTFHINAYLSSDDVQISGMEIGFVDFESEWEPVWRESGAGVPGLGTGRYRLKNDKKALVFNHYYQRKLLLISANDKYYLIGHPGIKQLYDELIRLGAHKRNFANNEVVK